MDQSLIRQYPLGTRVLFRIDQRPEWLEGEIRLYDEDRYVCDKRPPYPGAPYKASTNCYWSMVTEIKLDPAYDNRTVPPAPLPSVTRWEDTTSGRPITSAAVKSLPLGTPIRWKLDPNGSWYVGEIRTFIYKGCKPSPNDYPTCSLPEHYTSDTTANNGWSSPLILELILPQASEPGTHPMDLVPFPPATFTAYAPLNSRVRFKLTNETEWRTGTLKQGNGGLESNYIEDDKDNYWWTHIVTHIEPLSKKIYIGKIETEEALKALPLGTRIRFTSSGNDVRDTFVAAAPHSGTRNAAYKESKLENCLTFIAHGQICGNRIEVLDPYVAPASPPPPPTGVQPARMCEEVAALSLKGSLMQFQTYGATYQAPTPKPTTEGQIPITPEPIILIKPCFHTEPKPLTNKQLHARAVAAAAALTPPITDFDPENIRVYSEVRNPQAN